MDLVIEGTSAAAEHTEIEGTLAPLAEHTKIDEISDADTESTECGERTHWPNNSIFRVPEHIRSSRQSNFEPKLVSIGPYYHGRANLKRMEDLKILCIQEILKMMSISVGRIPQRRTSAYRVSNRDRMGEEDIHDVFIQNFMVLESRARAYYKEEFDHSPENFVKILFLDSCFIIRTIYALSEQVQESMSFLDVHRKEVRSDLLLLDNQIPLFFIKEVYEWFLRHLNKENLPRFNTVLEPFICLDMPWIINHDAMMSSKDAAHLLDLYWRCSLPPQMYLKLTSFERYHSEQIEYCSKRAQIDLSFNAPMVIANATELQQMAGIKFEKFKDKHHLDVIFSNGIMRMPRLKIDSGQITLLRNLAAFENCILPSMRSISLYMKLMDELIDSKKDVKLLQKCGVIYNTLESHERAATFFNDIGNFCFPDDNENPFSSLYNNVQNYYDSRWHCRWASLRHNYFSSPWAGISVVAAVTPLILSAFQTFYTVYGVYKPNN